MHITHIEFVARFKDRVWKERVHLLYDGFDNPAKTHYVAVARDVWLDLRLAAQPDAAIAFGLGISTVHKVFDIEIRLDATLPKGQIELRPLPDDEVEV